MQTFIARIMATLMLLSVFVPTAAQPCADMSAPAMDMSAEPAAKAEASHHSPVDNPPESAHCGDMPAVPAAAGDDHCAQSSSAGASSIGEPCNANCSCCPSHCASVLPPLEIANIPMPRVALQVTYRDIASSAEPESLIKPPRSA